MQELLTKNGGRAHYGERRSTRDQIFPLIGKDAPQQEHHRVDPLSRVCWVLREERSLRGSSWVRREALTMVEQAARLMKHGLLKLTGPKSNFKRCPIKTTNLLAENDNISY